MSRDSEILVGDVGGTHARFAIVDTAKKPFQAQQRVDFGPQDFESFEGAVEAYLEKAGADRPAAASIAMAGPVTNGRVDLTNRKWELSEDDLKKLGFTHALLINDFVAPAFAVHELGPESFRPIGPELPGMPDEPVTVLGAGTGFGVSCLARYRGRWAPIATEGGHIGFAPRSETQIEVLRILARRFGHVSVERVLSGPGIENVYAALEEIAGRKSPALSDADISNGAEAGNAACRAALDLFCSVYGAVAGDFALAHGARGGVFVAGGIAAKIEAYLDKSDFRTAFEDKGRLSYFVKPIPTRLILEKDAAFLGAAYASLELRDDG